MNPMLMASVLCVLVGQPASTPAAAPATKAQPAAPVPASGTTAPYRVLKTFELGGDGGWDCIEVDSAAHRLYIPRSTRVMVVDTETGKLVGEVPDTSGVHAVAIAPALGKGFSSNGKTDDVSVFDLKTLKVEKTVKAGKNPDAIIFEPITKRVFCFNGRSNDVTVISAEDFSVVTTIAMGGKPELAVVDGAGKVFANVEDTSEVVRIDAKSGTIEKRWSVAPGDGPSGLAMDVAHDQLFSVCGNEMMVVTDSQTGSVLATPKIGKGVDGAAFDSVGGFALSSNGVDGTLTVVRTQEKDGLKGGAVVQTLPTAKGARTIVFDQAARRAYLPTADFEPIDPKDPNPPRRPRMKAGTFKVVVVGV